MRSLREQTFQNFRSVIVDNSGTGLVRQQFPADLDAASIAVLEPEQNVGFGAACNLAAASFPADFVAVINDDAAADSRWLEELVGAMDRNPRAGSAASQVLLAEYGDILDSAGMLIAADGTSKQRGHRKAADWFQEESLVLLPSGSAALYRSEMFRRVGNFDESYFLYCEDTDLGLRAVWAGWDCVYAAKAKVRHRYSQSAGRASELKAFYVERNRLYTILKNFPFGMLCAAVPASIFRYLFHLAALFSGKGAAADFRSEGGSGWKLPWIVVRAHWAALREMPKLLKKRRENIGRSSISARDFKGVLGRNRIELREVAQL